MKNINSVKSIWQTDKQMLSNCKTTYLHKHQPTSFHYEKENKYTFDYLLIVSVLLT